MKMTKRFLALFLAVLMAFGSFPSAVIAAGEDQIAPEAEQTAPAPEQAPAEPAPAEPAPAEPAPAEPVSAPAEPAPEVQPEAPAEPAPEQQPEAPAEPAPEQQPEAQPPVEEPAPEQNEYVDEYPSTPSSYTVTWKMTVGGGALFPDIEDVYAPGALLVPPEEAAQYEAQGYELTYYLDEYKTQTIDFDIDFIAVNADMTVWADAVLPAPVPTDVPAPAEPAEVPAEPAEVPAEPAEVPAGTEQVPAGTEQAPEAGLPGFELPGIEVPTNVPETEIIAPEAQADANTNAENGIDTIAAEKCYETKFSIYTRGSGEINTNEPAVQLGGGYTTITTYSASQDPYNPAMLRSEGGRLSGIFHYWFNSGDGVGAALNVQPSDEQIKSKISSYDPSKQYVVWYIIKEQLDGTHVDGVIRNRDMVYLDYHRNGAPENTATNYPATQTVVKGETVTVWNTEPTWSGHKFLGWATSANGQVQYHPGDSIKMEQNTTLYAIWEKQQPELSITKAAADTENVYDEGDVVSYTLTVSNAAGTGTAYNVTVTDNLVGKPGFANTTPGNTASYREGRGWTIPELQPGRSVTITYMYTVQADDLGQNGVPGTLHNVAAAEGKTVFADVTTKARPQITVTVQYQDEDGTPIGEKKKEIKVDVGDSYDVSKENVTIAGYMFVRWNGGTSGTAEAGKDVTVTAVYAKDENGNNTPDKDEKYTVTYEVIGKDDYTVPGPDPVFGYNADYEVKPAPASVDTHDRYNNVTGTWTFDGWYYKGTEIKAEGTIQITSNVTLTGVWTYAERNKSEYIFDVTYSVTTPTDLEGVTNYPTAFAGSSASYAKGQTYTVSQFPEGAVTPEGIWEFDGWYLGSQKVEASSEQTMGEADVEYTGAWKFTYNAEALVPSVTAPEDVTYGDALGDPSSSVKLNGEEFTGYGEPTYTYYKDGTQADLRANKPWEAGTYTVKATWAAVPEKGLPALTAEDSFDIARRPIDFSCVIAKRIEKNAAGAYDPVTVKFTGVSVMDYAPNGYDASGKAVDNIVQDLQYDDKLDLDVEITGIAPGTVYGVAFLLDPETHVMMSQEEISGSANVTRLPRIMNGNVDVTSNYVAEYDVFGWLFLAPYDASIEQEDLIYGEQIKQERNADAPSRKEFNQHVAESIPPMLINYEELPFSVTYERKLADGTWELVEGVPTDVGHYKVKATWTANYYIKDLMAEDEFNILPRPITVHVEPDAKDLYVNDPGEVNVHPEVTGGSLVDGHTVTLEPPTGTVSTTEAGKQTVDWTGKAKITDGAGNNVTNNYKIEYVCGSATVKPLYTVRYHNGDDVTTEQVKDGHTTTAPERVREHYNFKGWATDKGGEVAYAPGAEIMVTCDMDLYAVWTYMQTFYGIVDGLTVEQVKDSAFTLSRNIKLADGTLVKFNKTDAGVVIEKTENPAITKITWTVELPETVIGTKPTVVATDLHHSGFYQSDYNRVWNGLQGVDGGMPVPDGATEIGLIYVRVRGTTSYQMAEGGTINVVLSKWEYSSNLGLSTGSTNLTEYWRACVGPVGATAVADPGYVFKGWYKYSAGNKVGALVTTDATLTPANMSRNSETGLVESNQWFIPVFEKVYTVTYHDGVDGAVFHDQVYTGLRRLESTPEFDTKGLPLDKNGNPDRAGYVFTGWKHGQYDGIDKEVLDNTDYYAQWALDVNNDDVPDEQQYVHVKVVGGSDTKQYNGDWQNANTTMTVTAAVTDSEAQPDGNAVYSELPDGVSVEIGNDAKTVTGKKADTYYAGLAAKSGDVYTNLEIEKGTFAGVVIEEVIDFSFTITPAELVINATASLTYTGNTYNIWVNKDGAKAEESESYKYYIKGEPTGLLGDDQLTMLDRIVGGVTGPDKFISKPDLVVPTGSYTIMSGGEDVSDSYNVKLHVEISFTRELEVYTTSSMYNGEEHMNVEVRDKATGAVLTEGTDYGVIYSNDRYTEGAAVDGDVVNAGHVTATVTGLGNYEGASETAAYEITRRPATVKANSDSWPYDGQEHKAARIAEQTGFVEGEGVTPNWPSFKSIRDVGSIPNVLSENGTLFYMALYGTDLNNYTITEIPGTLTITEVALADDNVEISQPGSWVYDGESHEWHPVIRTADGRRLVEGTDYTLKFLRGDAETKDFTNAGTITVEITFKGNYSGSVKAAYNITKRPVTLQSASGSWPYDGQEHSAPRVEDVTAGQQKAGIVKGESFVYSGYPSITNVSESGPNTYTVEAGEGTNLDNYEITANEGTLTIEAKEVDPENPGDVTVGTLADANYDGESHQHEPVVMDGEKVLEKNTDYALKFLRDGKETTDFTNAGEITVEVNFQGNYSGTVTRTYQIEKARVTVKADHKQITYGEERPELTATVEGRPAKGDKVNYTLGYAGDATPKYAGSYGIIVTADPNDNPNYELTTEGNTLTIDRRTIAIRGLANATYTGGPVTHTFETDYSVTTGSLAYTDALKVKVTLTAQNVKEPATQRYSLIAGYEEKMAEGDLIQIMADGVDVTENYNIYASFALNIDKKEVDPENPEANGITVEKPEDTVYNGQAQEQKPVVKDGNTVLTEGVDYELSYEGDTTNVGTVDVTVTFKGNYEGSAKTSYEITRAAVTVKANNDSKVYGTADPALTATVEGMVNGESESLIKYTVARDPGEDVDEYTITPSGAAEQGNYNVSYQTGTFTITAKGYDPSDPANGITVTAPEDTVYNGQAQEQKPVVKDGEKVLKEGTDYTLSYEGNVNAGTASVTVNFTGNYSGNASTSFEIARAAVTVTANNDSKVYGTADPALTATVEGMVNGESESLIKYTVARDPGEDVDEYTITPSGEDVQGNYTVKYETGIFTIEAKEVDPENPEANGITVEKPEDTVYNGQAQEQKPVVKDGEKVLKEGVDYTLSYEGNVNAGTASVTVNFTGNYSGNASTSFEIARAAVTVTANNDSKVYGTADPALTATVEGMVNGESESLIKYTVSRVPGENAGTYTITPSGAAVQGNYNVSYQTGTFTITAKGYDPSDPANGITVTAPEDTVYNGQAQEQKPVIRDGETVLVEGTDYTLSYEGNVNAGTASVTVTFTGNYSGTASTSFEIARATATVTTGSGTRVYNGAALTSAGSIAGLVNGETAVVNTTSITDAGTVANAYTIDWGSTNASNYNVVDGTIGSLTVTARPVTLTSGGGTKAYDGTPLTNFTVAVGGLGFVAGQGAAYTFTGSQTAVGTSANAFTYTLTGGAQARNYAITTANGTLTVTPAPAAAMAVNTPVNYLYTGTAHQWAPTVTGIGGAVLTAGTDYTVAYDTADFTNAGAVTVTVTGIGNYSGTVTRTYQINPRLVIMTSGSAARAYDGTPLTNNTVAIGGNGFVAGEGAAYTFTGSQTAAGTSANTFGYTLTGGAQARNYTITTTNGTLTVTPAPAAAMAVNTPTNFLYTGTAHQWAPTVTGIGGAVLTAGTDYTVAYSTGNFTDVGAVTVTVTGIGNYSGTVTRTYQINPRLVIMTSGSATKTFDGTALRARNVTVGGNGFAAGEGATYNVYGQRTPAGTAQNIFNYTLNAGTDADNYTIIQNYGTLTVTAAPNVPAVTQPDDGNGPTDIDEDETPLGGQPADEADEGDDAADADEEEPVQIEEDETPLAQAPEASPDYTLSEETIITEDETPLGAAPQMTVQECCILHFLLMLAALGVSIYYTHDRKKRQEREFEVRSEL